MNSLSVRLDELTDSADGDVELFRHLDVGFAGGDSGNNGGSDFGCNRGYEFAVLAASIWHHLVFLKQHNGVVIIAESFVIQSLKRFQATRKA